MGEGFDYLTGLYNRKGMYEVWKKEIRRQEFVQVLFVDLDNFKTVNDIYGHQEGDDTLVGIGEILKKIMPPGGVAIRLGGDEFVMMLSGKREKEEVKMLAEDLMGEVRERSETERAFGIISVSVGILWNAKVEDGIDQLLSYSDAAMYFAKESGKGRYVFFDDYAERIKMEWEMENTAEAALEEERFHLLYAPVLHLQNAKLLRTISMLVWDRGDGSFWVRADFEHVLEKSGILKKIDLRAFLQLCLDFSILDGDRRKTVLEIRLSQILLEEDVAEQLTAIAEQYHVPKERIEILVDERMFGRRTVKRLTGNLLKLRNAGFFIGLTDFGGDFSSFRYLDSLPVTTILFESGFVKAKLLEQSERSVLKTLFRLAKNEYILSIAQDVDTGEKAASLMKQGCDGAMGAFAAEPLLLEEYMEYIRTIPEYSGVTVYDFMNTLESTKKQFPGEIVGGGICYVSGISDKWGGLKFNGGPVETNLIRLPRGLFSGENFTVTMWIRPREVQNWVSVFFVRMQNGFISFMPTISGNLCMLRMHPDGDADVSWTDVMAGSLPIGEWTFVAFSYEAFSKTARVFLNGEMVAMRTDIVAMGRVTGVYLGGDSYQVSYQGDISALCIYDAACTEAEIKDSYLQYKEEPNFHGDDEPEGMVEYMVHDPAVFEDAVTKRFYLYCTGAQGLVSDDLIHWTNSGTIVNGLPDDAKQWTGSEAIWAPDIVKVGDEYRLYCSNSSWGVQKSCIFLAVSDRAEGPFEPKGVVLKTDDTLDVNGIDANIIEDAETKEQYMLYGSFWGGVHLLPLDRETGFARDALADGSGVGSLRLMTDYREGMHISEMPEVMKEQRMGICLARRPRWTDGAIEGPYMIYHPQTKYYYLFVSYGSLKNDYNIRIGRSRKITGPFLDFFGNDMADLSDENCTRGLMVSAGYCWLNGMPYMGPGHNSVLLRENGEMYLVSHIRKMQFLSEDAGAGLLQVRRLFLTPDDWLVAEAQPYAEEGFRKVRDANIPGLYERIELRPSMPQGIAYAHPLRLFEDGRMECCSIIGTWKRAGDSALELSYGPVREFVHMEKGLDRDVNKTTVLLSGLTSQGICTWGKKTV